MTFPCSCLISMSSSWLGYAAALANAVCYGNHTSISCQPAIYFPLFNVLHFLELRQCCPSELGQRKSRVGMRLSDLSDLIQIPSTPLPDAKLKHLAASSSTELIGGLFPDFVSARRLAPQQAPSCRLRRVYWIPTHTSSFSTATCSSQLEHASRGRGIWRWHA